ncbi:gamma-glutamyl-gamma-aminobutyrate hydrolase family protein [Candidatus Poribacteria bacterium]|nr:gamma-glutamyl-gamma-aminobutyrate hydrolase family protein [Candidatus Poribacteria bacterium]
MRPIIGITCGSDVSVSSTGGRVYRQNSVGFDYISAIEHAGGTPIVLPIVENQECISSFIDIMDGLLLSGGGDIEPSFFNEEPIPELGNIDPDRDRVEMLLAKAALEQDLPVLAICRGIQVLNVAAGGTLYQDISQAKAFGVGEPCEHSKEILKHRQSAPGWHASHTIQIEPSSLMYEMFGKQTGRVNSFHHQAVRDSAAGFYISARSIDGIIEAIESKEYRFMLGVQFHPEMMFQHHPEAANIFAAFVKACKRL